MFQSKITATARNLGTPVALVRDPAAVDATAGRMLVVDLNQPGALEGAVRWKAAHGGAVVGFASHVDTETLARARDAQIDRVLARSGLVAQLESLLKSG